MKHNNRTLGAFAALALFGVFALGILASLLTGAGVYRRLAQHSEDSGVQRTAAQYLSMRVRQSTSPQNIRVGSFGSDALEIPQELNGQLYLTRVYCHEGWLMELFSTAQGDFSPGDGEKILPLESLSISLEQGLLTLSYPNAEGAVQQLCLSLWERAVAP